jgi:hypothetical protein
MQLLRIHCHTDAFGKLAPREPRVGGSKVRRLVLKPKL